MLKERKPPRRKLIDQQANMVDIDEKEDEKATDKIFGKSAKDDGKKKEDGEKKEDDDIEKEIGEKMKKGGLRSMVNMQLVNI